MRPEDARLKEVYRLLVRRLHPDTRADGDPEVSALWHEVQEAYQAGKLERLEMLLALTDIRSKSAGEHTTLYQMREVLAELRRAFEALQKSLREARKEPAWNFTRGAKLEAIEARLQRRFHRGPRRAAQAAAPMRSTHRPLGAPAEIQAPLDLGSPGRIQLLNAATACHRCS